MKNKLFLLILIVSGFAVMHGCKKDKDPEPLATTEPSFTVTLDNNGFAPATATFTNTTVVPDRAGDVTYYWNFGDSTLSQEKNPTHFYALPGQYEVSLVAVTSLSAEIKAFTKTVAVLDPNATGTAIFFTNGSTVYSGTLNDQAPIFTPLYSGVGDSYGLVVDTVANKLYVSDETGGKIYRSDIDGSNKIDWRVGMGVVDGMAIDYTNHMLYFETEDGIRRTSLTVDTNDDYQDVVTGQSAADPEGLAVDAANGKLYWNNYNTGGIWMKDLGAAPGAGNETQIIPDGGGGGVIIVVNNKIYYDDYIASGNINLKSANLNGTGVATVATDISRVVFGLAYHPASNKLFWGDRTPGIIRRADPDGSNAAPWYTESGSSPRGIFFGRTKQ